MQNTSAGLLEFEELRTLVRRYVGSEMGRDELEKVEPVADRAALERAHAITAEAIDYQTTASKPQTAARGALSRLRFTDLPDVGEAVAILRIEGSVLDGKQIFNLLAVLDRAAEARTMLLSAGDRYPLLSAKAHTIGELRPLLNDLGGKIAPDGSLHDNASVALNRIRRGIEKQKKAIEDSLERFMRAHRTDGVLQEDFVTLRNDRFVVPIVTGQHGRVSGVIHGSSGSGHTMFVEPLETIELNNELVRLTEEELREVHRILREMTDRLRGHAAAIASSTQALAELDLLFAKASFASDFRCVVPRFGSSLRLVRARHPLLQDVLRRQNKPIVPISLQLDSDTRTLLLSGPNTGGKTVSLKTVGLLALMAQSGIPVPAEEAEFPVFDQVLADLGDNQSIAESLSSFSAHIRRINEILTSVTSESLVLLDELGRATDPEEGGALGVAIVDFLRGWHAFTLASTHLVALKIYGGSKEGVVNGSMGFDRETLAPTFELRLGSPGESAGLAIASRLGMPASLIERARTAMSSRERDLTDFLAQLQADIAAVSGERRALEEQKSALAAREKSLADEWAKRESAKLRELERRVEETLGQFQETSRQTIESIVSSAEQRKLAEQAQRKVAKASRELKEQIQTVTRPVASPDKPLLAIEEGVRVRLKNMRQPARVRKKLGADRIEVEAGLMKLQVSIDDVLEVLPDTGGATVLPSGVTFQAAGPRWDVSYRELNLIGKRAEEAIEELDRFLDAAMMAGVNRVRIVHGHGMGVLKRAVTELLSKSPYVEKFHVAPQNEGGTGATVAELKES